MKTLFYVQTILLMLCGSAFAEIDTIWTRVVTYEESSFFEITGASIASNGDYLLCGNVYNGAPNFQDMVVARSNTNGDISWIDAYGDAEVQNAWDILELDDGTVMVFATDYQDNGQSYVIRVTAFSPSGDSLWSRIYPGIDYNGSHEAATTSDGNVVIVADVAGATSDDRDVWLFKIDHDGETLWSQTYDFGTWIAYGRSVIESADGSLLIAGETVSDSLLQSQVFVQRVSSTGQELWRQFLQITDGFGAVVNGLSEDNAGNIFVCGGAWGIWWFSSAFLFRLDTEGGLIWSAQNLDFWGLELTGVAPDLQGGCYAVGTLWPDFGLPGSMIVQFDAFGDTVETWISQIFNSGFLGMTDTGQGGWLAYGFTNGVDGSRTGYIVRIGQATILQGRITHVADGEPVEGLRVLLDDNSYDDTNSNGEYLVATGLAETDIQLVHPCTTPQTIEDVELDAGEVNILDFQVGIPQYTRQPSSINLAINYDQPETAVITIGNPGSGDLTFIASPEVGSPDYDWLSVAPASGIITAGQSLQLTVTLLAESEQGNDSEFLGNIRVRNHSCPDSIDLVPIMAIVLGAEDVPTGAVNKFALHPAFPNPFNAETRLNFDLPEPSPVTLTLYNLAGQRVRVLAEDVYHRGSHSVSVSMPDLPSGVYVAHMQAAAFNATQKLVLIK